MNIRTILLTGACAAFALFANSASAQQQPLPHPTQKPAVPPSLQANPISIGFTPVACFRVGEMPLLQLDVTGSQELKIRAFFRHSGAVDWCSVDGKNEGLLSNVILPKFETNDEIEYFFLLLDGRRVVARSPQIYRTKVTDRCDTAISRHNGIELIMDCGQNSAGSIPSSMGAGYSLKSTNDTPPPSPSNPQQQ